MSENRLVDYDDPVACLWADGVGTTLEGLRRALSLRKEQYIGQLVSTGFGDAQ